jgi:hypothetical protein
MRELMQRGMRMQSRANFLVTILKAPSMLRHRWA